MISPLTIVRQARAIARELDGLTDVDWRHPAWWALVGGSTLLELVPPRAGGPDYLASDGGPAADTFMATPTAAPVTAADAAAVGLEHARRALAAVREMADRFPEQPLSRYLARAATGAIAAPVDDDWTMAVATDHGRWLVNVPRDPAADSELAAELAAVACGDDDVGPRLRRLASGDVAPVAVALSLVREAPATARHLHRRTWAAAGGPWLGIGWTDDQLVVSTSHMVVDGYGHACLAGRIAAGDAPASLMTERNRRAALARVGEAPLPTARPVAGTSPLGIATCQLPGPLGFAEFVYATAVASELMFGDAASPRRHTVTIQIPIAPGTKGDPDRRLRRVVPGLLSLEKRGATVESLGELRARLPQLLAREAALEGPLTRLLRGSRDLPVGLAIKRRLVGGSRKPRGWLPPTELLAGRGCASLLRLPPADRPAVPLYAVSAPALDPTPGDPRGGTVVTAVEHLRGFAVAVSGTGHAGDAPGASEFLQLWRRQLQIAQGFSDSRPPRNPPRDL